MHPELLLEFLQISLDADCTLPTREIIKKQFCDLYDSANMHELTKTLSSVGFEDTYTTPSNSGFFLTAEQAVEREALGMTPEDYFELINS